MQDRHLTSPSPRFLGARKFNNVSKYVFKITLKGPQKEKFMWLMFWAKCKQIHERIKCQCGKDFKKGLIKFVCMGPKF
jgi:hypothetical protein